MNLWAVLIAGGLITYAIRFSFLAGAHRLSLSPRWRRALRFVPIAVLTALIVPELLLAEGRLALAIGNHRLIAGLIAGVIAWRTGNTLLTIGAGMAALLLLQRFL